MATKKAGLVIAKSANVLSESSTAKVARAMESATKADKPKTGQVPFGFWKPPVKVSAFVTSGIAMKDEQEAAIDKLKATMNRKQVLYDLRDAKDAFFALFERAGKNSKGEDVTAWDCDDSDFARQFDKTVPTVFGKPCNHSDNQHLCDGLNYTAWIGAHPGKRFACDECRASGFRYNKTVSFIRNAMSALRRLDEETTRTAPDWKGLVAWIATKVFDMTWSELNTLGYAMSGNIAVFGKDGTGAKELPKGYALMLTKIEKVEGLIGDVGTVKSVTDAGITYKKLIVARTETKAAKTERVQKADKAGKAKVA